MPVMRYTRVMRTTVNIDEKLLMVAKRRAGSRDLTLGQLIEDALRREMAPPSSMRTKRPRIPVFNGGSGLRPGVDASSTRSLMEALDDDTPLEKLR